MQFFEILNLDQSLQFLYFLFFMEHDVDVIVYLKENKCWQN